MENIEKICIDFSGYIEVDKNDIKIKVIDEESGEFKFVDTKNLTREEIIEGYKAGHYYISLDENLKHALDGEEDCDLVIDED